MDGWDLYCWLWCNANAQKHSQQYFVFNKSGKDDDDKIK